jgi:hypothetical protein
MERANLPGFEEKIEDSPKGKALLRQTTKAETNYFLNFVDEIKALSIFGEEKKGGLAHCDQRKNYKIKNRSFFTIPLKLFLRIGLA